MLPQVTPAQIFYAVQNWPSTAIQNHCSSLEKKQFNIHYISHYQDIRVKGVQHSQLQALLRYNRAQGVLIKQQPQREIFNLKRTLTRGHFEDVDAVYCCFKENEECPVNSYRGYSQYVCMCTCVVCVWRGSFTVYSPKLQSTFPILLRFCKRCVCVCVFVYVRRCPCRPENKL